MNEIQTLVEEFATLDQDKKTEIIERLSPQQREQLADALEWPLLAEEARGGFTFDAFRAFFRRLHGMDLLEHWRGPLSKGFDDFDIEGLWSQVIEAFRGSAKSTTYNASFGAFLVACFPKSAGLIIGQNDDEARKWSKKIADTIANSPEWKEMFPHIVPDESLGWGATGYEVKLTHTDAYLQEELGYDDWRRMNSARNDASFVAQGYQSGIAGKRPFWLIVDDINNEKNTSSDRQNREVKTILSGTIFPAANKAKVTVFIGTPWNKSDALHMCIASGEFDHIRVPVYYTEGEKVGQLVWDTEEVRKEIERQKNLAGEIEFARMYLLDLSKIEGLVLKREWLDRFDHTAIQEHWPTYIGIDYTSTADPRNERVDYFALAVAKMIPGLNKLVIVDGVREKLSQAEAETVTINSALEHPALYQLGVEAILSGDEFVKMLMRSDLMKHGIVPEPLRGGPYSKSKGYRYEKIMAPSFQRRQVVLSDAENPFLRAFVDEWMNWQGDALEKMYNNDTLDAVFNCVWMAMPNFARRIEDLEDNITNPLFNRPKKKSVWSGLGAK